ncbi:hypothetical protein NLL38_04190 [Corynebacterium accolens]|uniref:hypothetical protein n=1 Tax=Corynebacterium accolens TaxID=38284 RepID=UPI00266FC0BE|nr:hypothetical protein [Corynebacterium accolens]WKS69015.1 hypothetical protein NLL40_11785 [Corynebacterium accolens]WKS72123.1 hypothetical protein NLL38_04190 [Corynebacterium accolens]WKS74448.1 hypothetical protein NLL44_04525 [Corynebacterium accolens]
MTTLADLMPQELDNHVGTWVNVLEIPHPVIYMGEFQSTGEIKHGAVILDPRYGINYERLDDCTPRPDLPRAWNPNGQPPAGKWEDDYTDSDGSTLTTGEDLDLGPHQEVRRWVGEWEEITK